jgi:hypothetical protein
VSKDALVDGGLIEGGLIDGGVVWLPNGVMDEVLVCHMNHLNGDGATDMFQIESTMPIPHGSLTINAGATDPTGEENLGKWMEIPSR